MNRFNQLLLAIVLVSGFLAWYVIVYRPWSIPDQDPQILIIGVNAEYPPFTFMEQDKIVGFDIDMMHEISRRLGKRIDFINMPFNSLMLQAQTGTVHAIVGGISPTQERTKQILFTRPYFEGDPFILITPKTAERVKDIHDLKGKTVVVNEGYTSDLYVSSFSGITILRLSSPAEAFLALQSKRAHVYITAQVTARMFLDMYGTENFTIALLPGTQDSAAIGVSRAYPELFDEIQNTLIAMIQDGTIQQLIAKWKLT